MDSSQQALRYTAQEIGILKLSTAKAINLLKNLATQSKI
jgi:hypothetical protein